METSYHPILHVENDENAIASLRHALVAADIANPYQVVKTGARALDYLSGQPPFERVEFYPPPCLILLELNVPMVNGIELLRWRQTQPIVRCIPVLVLTASNESEHILAAYEAGANGFLVKPANFDDLVEMMKSIQTFWLLNNVFAPTSPVPAPFSVLTSPSEKDHRLNNVCVNP